MYIYWKSQSPCIRMQTKVSPLKVSHLLGGFQEEWLGVESHVCVNH